MCTFLILEQHYLRCKYGLWNRWSQSQKWVIAIDSVLHILPKLISTMELNNWLKKKLSQGRFMMFWPTFWAGLEFVNPNLREGQYLLTLDLDFWVDLPASGSWTLPFETHHFLPNNTVYDTESGSYLDSYSSFKQTRAPVVLMYWKKYIYD